MRLCSLFWASVVRVLVEPSPAFFFSKEEDKMQKCTVTNVDALPAEINTPMTVRMTDHN